MSSPKIPISLVFSAIIAQAAIVAAQPPNETEAAATVALTKRVESFFGNLKAPMVNAKEAFADLLRDGPLANREEQLTALWTATKAARISRSFPGRQTGACQASWRRSHVSHLLVRNRAIPDRSGDSLSTAHPSSRSNVPVGSSFA